VLVAKVSAGEGKTTSKKAGSDKEKNTARKGTEQRGSCSREFLYVEAG